MALVDGNQRGWAPKDMQFEVVGGLQALPPHHCPTTRTTPYAVRARGSLAYVRAMLLSVVVCL